MNETFRLFVLPSFLEGFGRALDIGATAGGYNNSRSPREADFAAIQSDWQALGFDMWKAIEQEEKHQNDKQKQARPAKSKQHR